MPGYGVPPCGWPLGAQSPTRLSAHLGSSGTTDMPPGGKVPPQEPGHRNQQSPKSHGRAERVLGTG